MNSKCDKPYNVCCIWGRKWHVQLCSTKLSWQLSISKHYSKAQLNVHVSRNLKLYFLFFFWQFVMCSSKAGVTPWMAQIDQHWATHLLPSLPALLYGVFPFSCSAAQTPPATRTCTCLRISLHPPPMPSTVFSCTVCTAGDMPATGLGSLAGSPSPRI